MYVLEELLLVDSLEKTIRLEEYLNTDALQASEDEIKIIGFYKNIINELKTKLEYSVDQLKPYHGGKIDEEVSTTCIKNCLFVSSSFLVVHEDFLSYLPSLKTRSETYTFLKNLLVQIVEIETADIKPAIVLTDIYNGEERNISQSLKDHGIIKSGIDEQIIIGLPKIEKDNPLMWTVLVHEIAHDLAESEKKLNILHKINKEGIIDRKIVYSHQTILKNWIKEIIADLLSIRLIGPSYLYSFMFFSLLLSDSDTFNKTHPSPDYRMSLMISTLEKKGFKLEHIKNLYNILHQMPTNLIVEDNTCTECKRKIKPIPGIKKIKKEFDQLVDLSIEIIDQIKIKDFTPDNLVTCEKLAEDLKNFMPISSLRKKDNNQLNETYNFFKAGRFIASFDNEKNDVYALLEQFEEKPNLVSDIINAGWFHKVNNSYAEFIRLFFENDDKGNNIFSDKYENYKKYLNQNDELLLKSLEIADMHSLLEFGRSLL